MNAKAAAVIAAVVLLAAVLCEPLIVEADDNWTTDNQVKFQFGLHRNWWGWHVFVRCQDCKHNDYYKTVVHPRFWANSIPTTPGGTNWITCQTIFDYMDAEDIPMYWCVFHHDFWHYILNRDEQNRVHLWNMKVEVDYLDNDSSPISFYIYPELGELYIYNNQLAPVLGESIPDEPHPAPEE